MPGNLQASAVSESQIDLTWSASSDPESGIVNYRIYRGGSFLTTTAATSYSNTGLTEGTTYSYTVSAVNGDGMESSASSAAAASTFADTIPPTITSVTTAENPNQVVVVYSEPVEAASAMNSTNYGINNGIAVGGASLAGDLITVTLITSALEGTTYVLTVSNVRDRATTPNTITPNTQRIFTFSPTVVPEIDSVTTISGDRRTFTHVHTVSGSNRLLVIEVALVDGASDKAVSSVQYAGASLTRLAEKVHTAGSPRLDVWYLVNPSSGANNVEVILENDNKASIGAVSFTGVEQTTPVNGTSTSQGTGTSGSVTVASQPNDLVVDAIASIADGSPIVGSGQTQQWNDEMGGSGASSSFGAGSTEDGASSVSMDWSLSEQKEWVMIGFNVNAG